MTTTTETPSILQTTLDRVVDSVECRRVIDEIKRGARLISISGLVAGPAKALVLTALQRECGKQFAIVTQAQRDLESWERDLGFWYCALYGVAEYEGAIAVLPASETDPYAGASPHAETLEKRALALWRLARRKKGGAGVRGPRRGSPTGVLDSPVESHAQDARATSFVLLTSRAMARRTASPQEILRMGAVIRRDEDTAPEELVEKLRACGYVREDPVRGVGEFSIRGGILDVWPPGTDVPARIEFFGDAVDSIRSFDPETQLSTAQLAELEIAPMREFAVTARDFREWAAIARERWRDERFARALHDRTVYADEGEDFPGWEWLLPLVRETGASALDYFKDAVLVIDEPATIESYLAGTFQTLAERHAETDAADDLGLTPEELYLTPEELRARIDALPRIELRALGRTAAKIDEEIALDAEQPKVLVGKQRAKRKPLFLFPHETSASSQLAPQEVEWKSHSAMRYHGRLPDLARDVIARRADRNATTLFVMPGSGTAERVAEILREYRAGVRLTNATERAESPLAVDALVTSGRLSGGFELPSAGLVVHVESDLFDEAADSALERRGLSIQKQKAEVKRKRTRAAAFLSDFRDLKVGDFVVHIDHGIGRFGGLVTLDLG